MILLIRVVKREQPHQPEPDDDNTEPLVVALSIFVLTLLSMIIVNELFLK